MIACNTGAARRRRERRLRAALRHERQSGAMACRAPVVRAGCAGGGKSFRGGPGYVHRGKRSGGAGKGHGRRGNVCNEGGLGYDGSGTVHDEGGRGCDGAGQGDEGAGQGYDGADAGHGEGGTTYGGAVEEFAMNSSHESMSLDMSLSGMRPAPLLEPCSQCRIERHVGEDSEHFVPMVQVFDVPVPLTMGEVLEVLDMMHQSTVEHLRELVPQGRVQRRLPASCLEKPLLTASNSMWES